MRNFSRLASKLLGILLLYWALFHLCQVLAEIPLLFIKWSPAEKAALMRALRREGLVSGILKCIMSGAFAAILLSRTEWIISRLKLPEEPDVASMMAPGEVSPRLPDSGRIRRDNKGRSRACRGSSMDRLSTSWIEFIECVAR